MLLGKDFGFNDMDFYAVCWQLVRIITVKGWWVMSTFGLELVVVLVCLSSCIDWFIRLGLYWSGCLIIKKR